MEYTREWFGSFFNRVIQTFTTLPHPKTKKDRPPIEIFVSQLDYPIIDLKLYIFELEGSIINEQYIPSLDNVSFIGGKFPVNLYKGLKTNNNLIITETSNENQICTLIENIIHNDVITMLRITPRHYDDIIIPNEHVITLLSEMIKTNTTLTGLELTRFDFRKSGFIALSDELKRNTTLKQLCLVGNKIDTSSFHVLSELFVQNSTLKTLDLEDSFDIPTKDPSTTTMIYQKDFKRFIEKDYEILAFGLKGFLRNASFLRHLDLGSNKLGDSGVMELSKALKTHQNLLSLKLQFNLITDVGSSFLFDSLGRNTSLSFLDLCNNEIRFTNNHFGKHVKNKFHIDISQSL